jgi:hypothetical protein
MPRSKSIIGARPIRSSSEGPTATLNSQKTQKAADKRFFEEFRNEECTAKDAKDAKELLVGTTEVTEVTGKCSTR